MNECETSLRGIKQWSSKLILLRPPRRFRFDSRNLVSQYGSGEENNNLLEYTRPKDGCQTFQGHLIRLAVSGHSGQEVDEVRQNNEVVTGEMAKVFSQRLVQLCLICIS